jgi:hypothetical protein
MRNIAMLAILMAAIISASCNFIGQERVRGNGNSKTEDRSVQSFTSVSCFGGYDVYLSQGSTYSVRIEADENLLPYIETTVENGELNIGTKDGFWLSSKGDLKVYVSAPAYNSVSTVGSGNIISQSKLNNTSPIELEVSGSGDIRVELNAPEIVAGLSGSGNMQLTGETRTFKGSVTGSGSIKAGDLKAENVTVDIAGSGSADVFASVKLNVDVAGSGDVRYRGGAQVSSDIAGSGTVKKVD